MKWLMPYDLYERHAVTGRLLREVLGKGQANMWVLDVGGRAELLEQFIPYRVISVNVDGSGNLYGSGRALPFMDEAFDAVVSIDTLEHLPGEMRLLFLRECFRVARKCLVVAAPFGSEAHQAYEKSLHALYETVMGHPHSYLSEHVRCGLPGLDTLDRAVDALPARRVQRFFAGDYRWQGRQFERMIRASQEMSWKRHVWNIYNQIVALALFHPVRLLTAPTPGTNRFYLSFEK